LDVEGAAIIGAAIEPLTRPHHTADGPDPRTPAARRADALLDVCQLALRTGHLPASGGQPPQLNVTVDLDALQRDIAIGHLDTGALLTPQATRRLACNAAIIPVLLDGAGVPINLGRTRRTYTSCSGMVAAPSPAANDHPAGPTSTTSNPGNTAAPPTKTTPSPSAATTTS
jgi:hypothetical protein